MLLAGAGSIPDGSLLSDMDLWHVRYLRCWEVGERLGLGIEFDQCPALTGVADPNLAMIRDLVVRLRHLVWNLPFGDLAGGRIKPLKLATAEQTKPDGLTIRIDVQTPDERGLCRWFILREGVRFLVEL